MTSVSSGRGLSLGVGACVGADDLTVRGVVVLVPLKLVLLVVLVVVVEVGELQAAQRRTMP